MPTELQAGTIEFVPEDFEVQCAGCDKPVNLLGLYVRAAVHVERRVPFLIEGEAGGAKEGTYTGRDEGGIFHDLDCLAAHLDGLKRDFSEGEGGAMLKMFADEEEEHPYGQGDESYQDASEAHNAALAASGDEDS